MNGDEITLFSLFDDEPQNDYEDEEAAEVFDDSVDEARLSESVDTSGKSAPGSLTVEQIVEMVYKGMSAKNRERIPREIVEEITRSLNLTDKVEARTAVHLRIKRLKFTGVKHLALSEEPEPFTYDQTFLPGVNVLLIPDNGVGKSSVMKTIKYALTGDYSDYETSVRSWIQRIWLQFYLDETLFTIHIARQDTGDVGYIVFGEGEKDYEEVALTEVIHRMDGAADITDKLQLFFLQHLVYPR
jgi:hypothetical protein